MLDKPSGWRSLGRSAIIGGLATLADLLLLGLLVGVMGMTSRVANAPSLLAGAVVQFVGNRHYAFEASTGSLRRQLLQFVLTELVAVMLNGILFDGLARQRPLDWLAAMVARTVIGFVVFALWSYPLWRHVFRPRPLPQEGC